jgi:hypothetical protein
MIHLEKTKVIPGWSQAIDRFHYERQLCWTWQLFYLCPLRLWILTACQILLAPVKKKVRNNINNGTSWATKTVTSINLSIYRHHPTLLLECTANEIHFFWGKALNSQAWMLFLCHCHGTTCATMLILPRRMSTTHWVKKCQNPLYNQSFKRPSN